MGGGAITSSKVVILAYGRMTALYRLVSGGRPDCHNQAADPLRMGERRYRIAALERRRNRPSSVLADASKGLLL
jgi:hypothetical protein